jgi:bifunctional non-homologous end joining protein LigD
MTPDGALRHPSFLGLREDKDPRSVQLEEPAAPPPEAEPAQPVAKEAPAKARAPAQPKAKPAAKSPAKSGPAPDLGRAAGIAAAEAAGIKLTSPDRVVYPGQGVTKAGLVAYYAAVADAMLPYIAGRPLSLVRCPQGRAKQCFFQKHDAGTFPGGFRHVPITEKDGSTQDYMYIETLTGLIAGVQMNTLEWHLWGSRHDNVEKAERLIFDIDPDEGLDFSDVKRAATDMRDTLGALGLKSYPMVTGGKGIHVIVPIQRRLLWPEVKAFCRAFATMLADAEPDRFLVNMSKAKRKGKMFLDYLRNERGSTAISPYSTRSRDGAPVATPVTWDELDGLDRANGFSLAEAAARAHGENPWPDYFDLRQGLTQKILKAVGAT